MIQVAVDEFTRPADVVGYSANDSIADSTTAPTARVLAVPGAVKGSAGWLTKLRLLTNNLAWTPRVRVHLYGQVVLPNNDNAQLVLAYANRAKRIGAIDLPAMSSGGTGSDVAMSLFSGPPLQVVLGDDFKFWYRLQLLDAATPLSAQQFFLEATLDI